MWRKASDSCLPLGEGRCEGPTTTKEEGGIMVVKVWQHSNQAEVFSGSRAKVEEGLLEYGFHGGEVRRILSQEETYLDGGDIYVRVITKK
jgi:hypothetical protein